MNYFDVANGLPSRINEYRYYKCTKNTCNKVSEATKQTINIPKSFPEHLDPLVLRFHLKTIFPITIRC